MRFDRRRRASGVALLFLIATVGGTDRAGATAKLALVHQRLELPGVPVESFSIDLDRDGRRDLAVVVAETTWGEIDFTEPTAIDDSGTFVEALTVVPAVLDRRELVVFFGQSSPGAPFGAAVRLELPATVHAFVALPPSAPLLAITDDGVAELAVVPADDAIDSAAGAALALIPRIDRRTIFSGSDSYVPKCGLVADFDGDGRLDLLLPTAEGYELHLVTEAGLATDAIRLPGAPPPDPPGSSPEKERRGPPPVVPADRVDPLARGGRLAGGTARILVRPDPVDLNGDRRPDLLYRDPEAWRSGVRVRLGEGGGRFGEAIDPRPPGERKTKTTTSAKDDASEEIVWLGDLDGDGSGELVTSEEIPNRDESMRAELAAAKRPRSRVRIYPIAVDGRAVAAPASTFELEGYLFEGDGSDGSGGSDGNEDDSGAMGLRLAFPAGVKDLDGDGRLDLVALSLDFSLFEALRVLTTRSIRLGLDFAIYRQDAGRVFRPVAGLDLSGEIRIHLDRASLGRLSSFAGDFDGDGRADFLQLGRGRKVTIHRGQPGARYAAEPDLELKLEREPADAALLEAADLDGDGRSDLSVVQPIGDRRIGARAALDLYLSAASSAGRRGEEP